MKKIKIFSVFLALAFMFSAIGASANTPFDMLQSAALGEDKYYMPVELVIGAQVYSGPFNGTVEYIVYSQYEDSRWAPFTDIMEDLGAVSTQTSLTGSTGTYSGQSSTLKGDLVVSDSQTPITQRANWKQFTVSDNMNASFIATLTADKLTAESELINYTISTVSARLPIPHQEDDDKGWGDWITDGADWLFGGLLDFENKLENYRLVAGPNTIDLFSDLQKVDKRGTLKSNTPDYVEYDITSYVTKGSVNDLIETGVHSFAVASTDTNARLMTLVIVIVFFPAFSILLGFLIYTKRKSMKAIKDADKVLGVSGVVKKVQRKIK